MTIWAMNSGEVELGALDTDIPEDALVSRPDQQVLVRKLPAGSAAFLQALADGLTLSQAAEAAIAENAGFDLTSNLVALFASRIVTAVRLPPSHEDAPS
ncbi:MAG: hypothetical protein HXY30_07910 [Pseudorhodoplanes sp.]|nr:hypothetical protein [Pseudorhodoplanes sp.]